MMSDNTVLRVSAYEILMLSGVYVMLAYVASIYLHVVEQGIIMQVSAIAAWLIPLLLIVGLLRGTIVVEGWRDKAESVSS